MYDSQYRKIVVKNGFKFQEKFNSRQICDLEMDMMIEKK